MIIQDGYYDGYGKSDNVFICTDCFTEKECQLIQNVMLQKFNIHTTLKKRSATTIRIRVRKQSMPLLIQLIGKNIPEEFKYKLNL